MSHKKKQEQKLIKRKEAAKQRVLVRREKLREEARKMKEEERLSKTKVRPFRKEPLPTIEINDEQLSLEPSMTGYVPSMSEIKDKMIIDRLKHNAEILKQLEIEISPAEKKVEETSENAVSES